MAINKGIIQGLILKDGFGGGEGKVGQEINHQSAGTGVNRFQGFE